MREVFLQLVRLGIGVTSDALLHDHIDWPKMQDLAEQQGLLGVALDGIDRLPQERRPQKQDILQWIGVTLQYETQNMVQQKAASEMALIFHNNAIRTYVLKGEVVAECYPKPNHRVSADIDCYLLPERGDFDAWSLGNDLIRAKGFNVNTDFYKNSSFDISGVIIENHQFFTPFRGNKKLEEFERVLQSLMKQEHENLIEDTYMYRPPVLVTALFLIEHSYSHFLHEGLTWRHVLDWMMFSRKHQKDILWADFEALIDEYGFKKFYDSFSRLGKYILGEIQDSDLSKVDKKMLADIWSPLDLHETVRGLKGKLALVGNTWRARWKYHYFAEISMLHALWIQVKGFLFEKNPKLNNE